jgi:hypothetical protein
MMERYTLAVFEPDQVESTCLVMYYCCYSYGGAHPSESFWVVPGTWED